MATEYEEYLRNLLASSETEIYEFLKIKQILKNTIKCLYCSTNMSVYSCSKLKDGKLFKCINKQCTQFKTTRSIRSESIFYNSNLSFKKLLEILVRFSKEERISSLRKDITISKPSIINFYRKLRNCCERYFERNPVRLGGPGVVVQIDESLFCHKPKYHRGRASQFQTWVFGLVDTSFRPAKGYMVVVENRSAATLLPIIGSICLPGTIIHSDEWPAYVNISRNLGFEHGTVNHSLEFVNRTSSVHTQNIESYWAKQKQRGKEMKGIRRDLLNSYLFEYMWRDNVTGDYFEKVIDLVSNYYNVEDQ